MEDPEKQDGAGDNDGQGAVYCTKAEICRERRVYCWPAHPIDADKFYFIGASTDECAYKTSYGTLYTCSCPRRQEIYRKYKI